MGEYSFNLYRKTTKSFLLKIKGFTSSTSSSRAVFDSVSTFTSTPLLVVNHAATSFDSVSEFDSESTLTQTSLYPTFPAQTPNLNCYGQVNNTFSNTSTALYLGNISPGGSNGISKSYIPFTVSVGAVSVLYATLKITCNFAGISDAVKIKIGCEDVDDSTAPADWSTLNSKVMTSSYYSSLAVPDWVLGTTYYFDITDAVQDVLYRSGWSSGNTMGVIITDYGSSSIAFRQFASTSDGVYTHPELEIVYGGNQYVFSVSTSQSGADTNAVSPSTYKNWCARLEITRPLKLTEVKWDINASGTYNLQIQNDASTLIADLGDIVVNGATSDVTWTLAAARTLKPGVYRFLMTLIPDAVTSVSSIASARWVQDITATGIHTPLGTPTYALVAFYTWQKAIINPSASYGGVPMTLLKSIPSPDNNLSLYLFGLHAPGIGAQTVIVNWSNLGDNISYHIIAETVNGSLDVDGMNIASGHVGQVASVSVPSKVGDLLLDFGGGDQYVGSLIIDSSQTSEYQNTTPPQVFMSLKAGKAGTNTMSWTFAPVGEIQDWVEGVISIPVSKLPTAVTGVNVAINNNIPPLSYGFFNYLNTFYEGNSYGRILPVKLVGYVQV